MEKSIKGIAACGLALCLAASASAQSGTSSSDLSKVRENNRMLLIPDDALKIRGIAQGANDFMANTPALRGGPTEVELVAAKDARERRLAMYEDNQRFDSAPSKSRMTATDPGIPTVDVSSNEPDSTPPDESQDDEAPSKYLLPAAFIGLVIYTLKKLSR